MPNKKTKGRVFKFPKGATTVYIPHLNNPYWFEYAIKTLSKDIKRHGRPGRDVGVKLSYEVSFARDGSPWEMTQVIFYKLSNTKPNR